MDSVNVTFFYGAVTKQSYFINSIAFKVKQLKMQCNFKLINLKSYISVT